MVKESLLDAIPNILEYKTSGLIAVVLLIIASLLIYVVNKENPKTAVIKIIKLFMYLALAMFISFLLFQYFNSSAVKEWSIESSITLKDYNGKILHKISRDNCGNRLSKSITVEKFLGNNLKIILLPNLPYKSFKSSYFTARIPENLSKNNLKVWFELHGFHCISDNCQLKLNSSNYNLELELVFIQNEPDTEECASLDTTEIH